MKESKEYSANHEVKRRKCDVTVYAGEGVVAANTLPTQPTHVRSAFARHVVAASILSEK